MKPRVLMLSQAVHTIPPLKGAAVEQWIAAVAQRLGRYEAHVVSMTHPGRPDRELEAGVHYRRIRIGALYNRLFRKLTRLDPYSYIGRVARHAQVIAPAIVHLHNAPQFAGPLAARLPGVRLILHMHNEKSDKVDAPLAALVGCSAYIRDWYRERHLQADRFTVLDNGVDPAAYDAERSPQSLRRLRALHGVPADRFVVLYAGRISPEKGPDLAAEALRHLDAQRFHLVLLGEWPQGRAERSERVRFAQGLRERLAGLPHSIIDVVPPEHMPQMYALGDLLLVPSRFEEPFSMVAIEAMAAGLPVLALKKGGMIEYMSDGENALLLGGDATAEQVAAAISKASREPEHLQRMAARARSGVAQRFAWDRVAAATEQLYDEVLAQT